jgi:hypothetical protein
MTNSATKRLGLPCVAAGQLQKHVTVNEALKRLDDLIHLRIVSRTQTEEPAHSADGAIYLLPAGATGLDWSTRPPGSLMRSDGEAWRSIAPCDGSLALVGDTGEMIIRDDGEWRALGERLGSLQGLTRFGLGNDAEQEVPFFARLNAALWTALESEEGGTDDLRVAFSKTVSGAVVSLAFQSAFSGRAELGLIGDDDLQLKVSADGATWKRAWAVDSATGRVTFDQGAGRREVTVMTASGSYVVPDWARTIEAVAVGGGGGGGAGSFGSTGTRFGGGGGGAAGVCRGDWPAGSLAATLSVAVGTGGPPGLAASGGSGNGSVVYSGSRAILVAPGGGGGGLGGNSAGAAGLGGAGTPNSNGGGASSVTGPGATGKSFDRPDAPGGGGAGGGLDAAGVARAGGAGGDGGALAVKALGGLGGAGAGSPGAGAPAPALHWAGGGGGGGGAASAGAGHDGAPGGSAGGGGGGGGAGMTAGGTGGSGGSGVVWLTAIG